MPPTPPRSRTAPPFFDLNEAEAELVRIQADSPHFPWWTLALLPTSAGLIIWATILVINRGSRSPAAQASQGTTRR